MNLEKISFCFFIVFAMTLNFGFVQGEYDNLEHHNVYELFAAVVVNIIAMVLKFGDRTQMGALLLATSLVAVVQLCISAMIWTFVVHIAQTGMTHSSMATVVSFSSGALLANVVSVVLLVIETAQLRR